MSALSYFSARFPLMWVVWEASAPTWMVFTGTLSVLDGRTLGALAGALAHEDEGSDPSALAAVASPAASAWSFSTAMMAAVRLLLNGEDACRGWHLEDQVPVMGNGHESVQSWFAYDGIEGEVNLRNFELHVLRAEVHLRPECDRQGDGPHRVNGIWAHSGEWARDGASLDSGICRCFNAA
jgi:hypothetical protein